MKKYFVILLLIVFAFNLNSQQPKNNEQRSSADYLEKSKRQRTTGFILLGGGVAAFTGGTIAMQHSQSKGENEFPFVLGGLAMTITSIPFFISSGCSKHKAKIYMNREALLLTPNLKTGRVYNSVGVRINF